MEETLKVLMWKHIVVRFRRFVHTPIEILSPLLLFIFLLVIKSSIYPVPTSTYTNEFNVQHTDTVNIANVPGPSRVFYTPETNLTSLLMEKVGKQLSLQHQSNGDIGGQMYGKYYTAIPYEADYQKYAVRMSEDQAIVIFPNMTSTWPRKLDYTIRMKNYFHTESYTAESPILMPHENFGTIYEPFMKLQWAIDSSYLEVLTANELLRNVMLQEFPFVKTVENSVIKQITFILPTLCWLSLMLVFVFLMARLLEERINGIQELIRMVGVSANMLGISHFLNVLPAGIVYALAGTLVLTASDRPYIPNSSGGLIFTMLILHFVSVVAMAFASSYLVKNTQYTVSLATVIYISSTIPSSVISNRNIPEWVIPFCGLLPHEPMRWFWRELGTLEEYGIGVNFANIAEVRSESSGSVLLCYIALVVQSIVFFSIAWYLARVNPGPYGQALPWNFFCQKQYWSSKKVEPEEDVEEMEEVNVNDSQYYEAPHKNAEVGIKIVNVTKVFEKLKAVNNVTLDVYKGEITVLLGHNGAGKTTLMSIITGMMGATEGNVYVEGLDTVSDRDDMRKMLGLCPQHNLFFPDLTVLEHVMFFSMLKGASYAEAKKSGVALLERLGIADKLSDYSSQLSGGMKRRLQLACALAGDAKVLVLDEPTSGLDVETRRELWNLLLSLRGSYTVLISTHFMEEAEALGDRVAALHAGRLRCHATPMYLKRAIGTGYRLSLTTIGMPNVPYITEAITSQIPEATVKETSLNSISYNLPSKNSAKFPELFNVLEAKRPELGIESIGVGISNLEEVFWKLCSDVTTTFSDDDVDGEAAEPVFEKLSGIPLYAHQLLLLMIRQFKFMWSKKLSFFIVQIFLPIAFIFVVTILSNGVEDPSSNDNAPSISMNLDLYDMADRRVLYNNQASGLSLKNIGKRYFYVDFQRVPNVEEAILRVAHKDVLEYHAYLAGVELNDTDAKVLFTTLVRHAAPVALNLLSNMIANQLLPYAEGDTIVTRNHPIQIQRAYTSSKYVETKDYGFCLLWSVGIVFVTLTTLLNGVALPCMERVSGTRHIHIMTGCPPALHWAATLLSHLVIYGTVLIVPITVLASVLEKDSTINQSDFLGVMTLVLILGCVAFLSLMYLVSFHLKERGAAILLTGVVVIFCIITPLTSTAKNLFKMGDSKDNWDYLMDVIGYVLPPHTFTVAVLKCVYAAKMNALCILNRNHCPNLGNSPGLDRDKCCVQQVNPSCYLCFGEFKPGLDILLLLIQFLFYMTMVVMTEYGLFNSLCDRLFNARYQPTTPVSVHDMVRSEKTYVDKAITLPKNQIPDAMLVSDVHKNYWRIFRKSCNAVQGVDFSVKKGECFGLLGVNGAGKSTTFKMLTGVECTTRGAIYANQHFMSRSSSKYLQSLGYCPQFSGLDGFLTGRDNLTLLLTLRGLSPADVQTEAKAWIEIVGLEKYAGRAVCGYSGGCARRLAAAAALCRGGAVTLLDEPTAGVDVAARRRVWAAVRRASRSARALIITSHSMDEMEALCGRIAILSAGRVVALGAAAALRAAHAAGHAVQLKLAPYTPAADVTDGIKPEVSKLKAALKQKFNCTLRDEHKTMLHYHINETMRYSDLFTSLEQLRTEFPTLLEDYSVTETTLEEVFLSFAKEASKEQPAEV